MSIVKTLVIASTLIAPAIMLGACEPRTNAVRSVSVDPTAIGGAFTLVDQDGVTVTEKDFLGAPQLVYFGFISALSSTSSHNIFLCFMADLWGQPFSD